MSDNTQTLEEIRSKVSEIVRYNSFNLSNDEAIEALLTLINSEAERREREAGRLADVYARIIAAAYDGEPIEQADKRLMADYAETPVDRVSPESRPTGASADICGQEKRDRKLLDILAWHIAGETYDELLDDEGWYAPVRLETVHNLHDEMTAYFKKGRNAMRDGDAAA